MAAKVTVRITGLEQRVQALRDGGAMLRDMTEPLAMIQPEAVKYAQSVTPVDTGRLRKSTKSARPRSKRLDITWATRYAPFPLFGTVHQRAAQTIPRVRRWLDTHGTTMLKDAVMTALKSKGL